MPKRSPAVTAMKRVQARAVLSMRMLERSGRAMEPWWAR
jgi:hypothetical protein